MIRLGISFTKQIHEALDRLATKKGVTVSSWVRTAVIDFLRANGEEIESRDIKWGGWRGGKTKSDLGGE